MVAHLARTKACNQGQTARLIFGVQLGHQHLEVVRRSGRPALQSDWVQHTPAKLDMCAVGLAGAVADPDHVARPGHVLAGQAVDPAQRFFVFQQESFVARVEIHPAQHFGIVRGDASGIHEIQGIRDAVGNLAVAFGLVMLGKAKRPGMNAVDVGKATGREGPQQVQAGGRLGIGLQHARRIGDPRLMGRFKPVDDVAAIAWVFHPANHLGIGRARLGKLACHAADLDHRHLGAIGQHHGHLQHNAEGVADVVGRKFGEAFGAIATLQQKGVALSGLSQLLFQPPRLTGKDQGGVFGQLRLNRSQCGGIGIIRHLHARFCAPIRLFPALGHGPALSLAVSPRGIRKNAADAKAERVKNQADSPCRAVQYLLPCTETDTNRSQDVQPSAQGHLGHQDRQPQALCFSAA